MANPALWGFGLAAVGLIAAGLWLKLEEGGPVVRPAMPAAEVPEVPADPATRQVPASPSPLPAKPDPAAAPFGDQGASRPARGALGADPAGGLPRLVASLRDWGREAATRVDQAPP